MVSRNLLSNLKGFSSKRAALLLAATLLGATTAHAGGPKFVAGVTYFNPAVVGQPVVWAGGQLQYSVDQGALGPVSNAQAVAMVDAAAAVWNTAPAAAVQLTDAGSLAEDVNGGNVVAGQGVFSAPADVTPQATGTPVAVIFDADGSVIDALEGAGASQPTNCAQNALLVWIDNMNPNATMAHAAMVLNGLCAGTPALMEMMSYQVERAFGRILGLDYAQVNSGALSQLAAQPNGLAGWPVMQPGVGQCNAAGGNCIPNPASLRMDDIAALNRLYPVTAQNQSSFPGKLITAAHTVSIQGTISFRNGQGMQGVNVVARPLDANGNPLYQYTVTFVSGGYFAGNRGNAATGWTDANGNRYDRFGSDAPALEGFFDLSGIPLPPGVTSANYQVSFEAVNPLNIESISVGPYVLGSPTPSGSLAAVQVSSLALGGSRTLNVKVANSAAETSAQQLGAEAAPMMLPASGMWTGRLAQIGGADWLLLPVRGNRIFTVVTQALNESGAPSGAKAMPALGVWDGFDQVGSAAVGSAAAQNGIAMGETWLQVATAGNDTVKLCVTDQRGDGRPDYLYRGWVLYADTVSPARIPAAGGTIVIRGIGFRPGDTVEVGGVAATVTSILPTEITAVVAAAAGSQTGSMDVVVNDLPLFYASATIPGGVSYDSGNGDALGIATAPMNQVPLNVPQPFSVLARGANGAPAGGVTVVYTVTGGTATLGCGQTTCSVTASGDGRATLAVTATNGSVAAVTASLTNGASVQAQFYGVAPAAITAIGATLHVAAGSLAQAVQWPVQALVQSGGAPAAGLSVAWQGAAGIGAPGSVLASNANGIAAATLTVGPLAEGQTVSANACLVGANTCATFNAFGSRPEFATLTAVSGTAQSMSLTATPAPVVMRVLDMDGNPMAGGTVTVNQALYAWTPPCPRHGRCAAAPLLATQATTAISALDGTVTVTPLTMPGVATNLTAIAATGNAGSLTFTVEQHP